jgi:hypothetical protein
VNLDELLQQGGKLNEPAKSVDDLLAEGGRLGGSAPIEPKEGVPPLLAKTAAPAQPTNDYSLTYYGTPEAFAEDTKRPLLPDPNKGLYEDAARIQGIFSNITAPMTQEGADKHALILQLRQRTGLQYSTIAEKYPEFKRNWELAQTDPVEWVRKNPKLAEYVLRNPEAGVLVPYDPGLDKLSQGLNEIWGYISGGASRGYLPLGYEPKPGATDAETTAEIDSILAKGKSEEKPLIAPPKPGLAKQTDETKAINESTWGGALAVGKRTNEAVAGINRNLTYFELGMARHPLGGGPAKPTALLEQRILDLEQLSQPGDYKQGEASKFASSAFSGAASSIMIGADIAKGAGVVGLAGGVIGSAATVLLTHDPKLAWEGFVGGLGAGAKLGGTGGAYVGTVKTEGGGMYAELLNATLDDGTKLTDDYAWAGALIGANLKAAIEVGTMGPMLKMFGPAGEVIRTGSTKQAVAALLKQPAFLAAAKKLAGQMLEATAAESGEEGLQRWTDDAVKYLLRSVAAGTPQKGEYEFGGGVSIGGGIQETLAAVPSSALLSVTGAASQHAQIAMLQSVPGLVGAVADELRARAGYEIAQHLHLSEAAHESAAIVHLYANLSDSPTTTADPEGVAEVMHGKPFYVGAQQYVKFHQDAKVDPAAAAKQDLGPDGEQRLKEALAAGKPLEVPAGKFLEMPLEKRQALEPYTTTRADVPTPAEIDKKAYDERVQSLLAKIQNNELDAETPGEAKFLEVGLAQLEQAVGDPKKAREKFELMRAVVRTYAEVFGKSADELFENFALHVSAGLDPTMEEVLQEHAKTVNRAEEYLRDANTGLPNENAFAKARKPAGKPNVGVLSVEGFKWLNDQKGAGHEKADLLARAVGNVLQGHAQAYKLPGSEFVFHVKDQAELESIAEKVRQALPPQLRGFEITSALGETVDEAKVANQKAIDAAIAEGRRANPRPPHETLIGESGAAERPKGLSADVTAESLQIPETKASGVIPAEAVKDITELKPEDYFDKAYRDPRTGEWTERAWNAMRRKAHVVMIDAAGLGKINANPLLGKPAGNEMLMRIGRVAKALDGHRVDFTHLHGDEYCAQADSAEALEGFVDQLQAQLRLQPLRYWEPEEEKWKHQPIELHVGYGERSLKKADDDLNERKERKKAARAAGVLRGGSESARSERTGRGEGRGAEGVGERPDRGGEKESARVPEDAQGTHGDSGVRNRLPVEAAALDYLKSKQANARSPVMRKGWRRLAAWYEKGRLKGEEFPDDLPPDGREVCGRSCRRREPKGCLVGPERPRSPHADARARPEAGGDDGRAPAQQGRRQVGQRGRHGGEPQEACLARAASSKSRLRAPSSTSSPRPRSRSSGCSEEQVLRDIAARARRRATSRLRRRCAR